MVLTFDRIANSCEDLYWDTVRDRYVLYTHANSAWEEVPIRETGTNSMRGETKREGGGAFQGGVSKQSANSQSCCGRGLR